MIVVGDSGIARVIKLAERERGEERRGEREKERERERERDIQVS